MMKTPIVDAEIIKLDEWHELVKDNSINPWFDGRGYYARDGYYFPLLAVHATPKAPGWATHVAWFAR